MRQAKNRIVRTLEGEPIGETCRAKLFAFRCGSNQSELVIQPLALVLYEELMPGSQLVNRLQDLHYRVQAISDPNQLSDFAQREGPMLVFVDLGPGNTDVCAIITKLKQNQATSHIPIIAFADEGNEPLQAGARQAGANLVATDVAVLAHLSQLIEQALHAD